MSKIATASLCYGFQITNQRLLEKIQEKNKGFEEGFEGKEFELIFNGTEENEENIFLCIKESVSHIRCWDKPKLIQTDKLSVGSDWDEKLLTWANKYNIKKPKIGWWLCSTMG